MKRIITTLVLAAFVLMPSFAQNYTHSRYYNRNTGRLDYSYGTRGSYMNRDTYFGFRVGPAFTTVNSDNPYLDGGKMKTGLNVGVAAGFALTDRAPLFLESGIYYVEKGGKNEAYIEKLRKVECPVVVVINKIDISTQEKVVELMQWWKEQLPAAEIIPASAQERFNLESILEAVSSRLPEAPAWFDKDQFTDKNLRFFASEILREKIFLNYSDEIPYSCQVEIEAFHEGEDRYEISAVIYVMRESQKGIIIGKKGAALKKVGTEARLEMEDFFQKKVFLSTFVKVDPDWRESRKELRRFGYEF